MRPSSDKRDTNVMCAVVKVSCGMLQPGKRCQTVAEPPVAERAGW